MFLIGFLSLAVPSMAVRKTRLTWVNGIAHTLEHMEDAKDKVKINLYPSDGQEDCSTSLMLTALLLFCLPRGCACPSVDLHSVW
jgi:hypothetical protein